ncbi:MAG: transcriptional antiterminator, Rof [Hydrogenophilaceae bacterium]|nr:transcriptional antiterminator, Rof [Hydrogenophilaceae bacterium]
MEPYQPVACAFHEGLEFAVLRRQRLRLHYRTETGEIEAVVLPIDVATRDGAEWLTFQAESGANQVIRLDAIVSAQPA